MVLAASDWRDAHAYTWLMPGDRRCFAWEWLRRTSAYRQAWIERDSPHRFGLIRLADPDHDALLARPIWNTTVDHAVLHAEISLVDQDDCCDFARFVDLTTTLPAPCGGAHILLSDGLRSIRIDVQGGDPMGAPVSLNWHISGVAHIGVQVAALGQFITLARQGRFSRNLHPPERRARRWIAMLRVADALASGASTREIVSGLFGVDTSHPRWRTDCASWRLRAQRLTASARAYLAMGPAGWLNGEIR
ncbi:DNA -binding domain-containing protein [Sphingobium subterraneum]|uniref:DUF2285 domain-containing protein n=1 Tax=Sphingobium subterraneum TaxID=627688 RepID=A0A841J4F2_9SPHN|nr:DUF2285 domain-containing protein [Sphingobium subterraneum]MBB6125212.1 hypothetical protein [Sphingobium subterraneum]